MIRIEIRSKGNKEEALVLDRPYIHLAAIVNHGSVPRDEQLTADKLLQAIAMDYGKLDVISYKL